MATKQTAKYVKAISAAWKRALEGILEAGKILAQAEKDLGRKQWLAMVENELPFTRRTAEKLLKIASDTRLTNPKYRNLLPPRWTTLHELTFLKDAEFERAITEGLIHPDMERSEAERLIPSKRQRAPTSSRTVKVVRVPPHDDPRIQETDSEAEAIAIIKAEGQLSDDEIVELENDLNIISERYGLSFSYHGYRSKKAGQEGVRRNVARASERWLEKHRSDYNMNGTITAEQIYLIEEAIRQLEHRKFPTKTKSGDFQDHDIRNPNHPFHECYKEHQEKKPMPEYGVGAIYDYCRLHMIVTKYTPLEFVDYRGYLQSLMIQHCVGNKKRKAEVVRELKRLAKREEFIKEQSKNLDEMNSTAVWDKLPKDFHPFWLSTFRSDDLSWHTDIEPGYAKSALDLIVQ